MQGDEGLKHLSGRGHVSRQVELVTFTSLFMQVPPCLPNMHLWLLVTVISLIIASR